MNAAAFASATILRDDGTEDVAFPEGTTIAGLLAMLRINTTTGQIVVTTPDGKPADLGLAIGIDVPSGLVLAVVDTGVSAHAREVVRQAHDDQWYVPAAQAVGTAIVVLAAELLLIVSPLVWPQVALPWFVRAAAAIVAMACVLPLAVRTSFARSAIGLVAVPASVGLAALAVVQPSAPNAGPISVVVATCAAFLAVCVISLFQRAHDTGVAVMAWGLGAAASAGTTMLGLTTGFVAPLLVAAGVVAVCVAPQASLRVPESQLVDLTLLAPSAATPRAPAVSPPSTVTNSRVRRTLANATASAALLTAGGSALAVGMAPFVDLNQLVSIRDWGAVAFFACSIILLTFSPLAHRSRIVSIAPRVAAAVLLVVLAVAFARMGVADIGFAAAGLAMIAFVVAIGRALASRREPSAFLGRMGDILVGLAALALLPSAVFASGLFDLVWQALS